MACFVDINVSQGTARCGRIFNMHLTATLPGNLPVKKTVNRLRFDRIMVTSLWPRFLAHPVYTGASTSLTDGSRMLPGKKFGGGIFSGGELRISPFWYQRLTICLNAV